MLRAYMSKFGCSVHTLMLWAYTSNDGCSVHTLMLRAYMSKFGCSVHTLMLRAYTPKFGSSVHTLMLRVYTSNDGWFVHSLHTLMLLAGCSVHTLMLRANRPNNGCSVHTLMLWINYTSIPSKYTPSENNGGSVNTLVRKTNAILRWFQIRERMDEIPPKFLSKPITNTNVLLYKLYKAKIRKIVIKRDDERTKGCPLFENCRDCPGFKL